VKVPPEPRWTKAWEEPVAFDGCSTKGPGQAGPAATHSFRENRRAGGKRGTARSITMNALDNFLFGVYPYICLTVFLLGSLIRFDRDQYTWKSDSSQLLRTGSCAGAATCSHRRAVPVLWPPCGHVHAALRVRALHQRRQQAADGHGRAAWPACWALSGVSLLLHRRIFDPRIRINSRTSDIVLLVLLWLQLALGLATLPLSAQHLDGSMMMKLADWAQRIVTFRPVAP
jgi:nitrate reductase gamma subunit